MVQNHDHTINDASPIDLAQAEKELATLDFSQATSPYLDVGSDKKPFQYTPSDKTRE